MSEFPLWTTLIAQESPAQLQEMYPSPIDKGNPSPWMVSEDEMTDTQKKRREEIVKSMKDKTQDFKDRYGDRWKEVMYATATKQAMSEAEMVSGAISPTPGPEMAEAEQDEDTKYQKYFRAMLKKHGYNSPADIPDNKKDDFFNAVDAGYTAKNEGWAGQSSHQYGVTDVATEESDSSDDQDMMSAQLDSLAQKSATLHDILTHVMLGDVPAWIQTKVANADKDVSAILDYMKYEEAEPVTEADNKDAMIPLRMQAAMVIAKSLGTVKGSGQSTDIRVSGGTPESIVNQAIRVWLSGSHTSEGWALGAKMLKLAKQMGIKWDDALVRQKLAPITLKKLGLLENETGDAPSPAEKLRQRQEQEKSALELRHTREKLAQQQRDATDKLRQQQLKQAEKSRPTR